ncbi:MarR family winged helix-turn-helix transcriptional regulator [Pseudoramibacter sp.]|jgi:DNA-binding MarR family transcriptional regulator|uniref:MarR family winged helix-turn-helix transcriptional regulator n=1 Tax=Pseudoramibacter sp. TaxID=2034862 RepID=UPI0025D30B4C|nr:MarR family transcriptional regulator [Pseudoramibacter sp.]MCH4072488.1 MarR family transcriptional regulator [Pseudoramibacter sp.]MCH4106259.1 MarR family transcriptional regulator [Pseudoramibacter sp.]
MENREISVFWETFGAFRKAYVAAKTPVCAKYSLPRRALDILLFLHHNPTFNTAAQIAEKRGWPKSQVSTALKTLKARGYVTGNFKGVNRKTVYLALTEKAVPVIQTGTAMQRAFFNGVLSGCEARDLEAAKRLIQQMHDNLKTGRD